MSSDKVSRVEYVCFPDSTYRDQTIYAGKVKVQAGLPYGLVTLPIPDNSVCTHLTPGCPVMPRKQYSYTYTGMLPPQIPS
ncbi:hypothetical protein T265_15754, partial [Opisthorchis viverrini]